MSYLYDVEIIKQPKILLEQVVFLLGRIVVWTDVGNLLVGAYL
jgi:hypothetical protein